MASEVSWFWFQSQFKRLPKTIESINDNELSELNVSKRDLFLFQKPWN